MSIFGSIMEKIFHSVEAKAISVVSPASSEAASPASAATPATPEADLSASAAPSAASAQTAPAQAVDVDVDAVLTAMAAKKSGGNWQTSIVDLLKLLDLDSSLAARKQLAQELDVHAGADGSAEENVALHKAVMQKLAENGGQVPANLRG